MASILFWSVQSLLEKLYDEGFNRCFRHFENFKEISFGKERENLIDLMCGSMQGCKRGCH